MNNTKIGVIGLGDIAKKAYLPVIGTIKDIELVFCTRNEESLHSLASQYRITEAVSSVDHLIEKNIQAAFVHSATLSHFEIVKKLLNNNIHVYVDKPITYNYSQSEELTRLAEEKKLILFSGFNRRYAPFYKELKNAGNPDLLIMEKNRINQPGDIRTFIMDDFIHVVDTVRYLLSGNVQVTGVTYSMEASLLHYVAVTFTSGKSTALAIMNRMSGKNEEKLEFMNPGNKWIVSNLEETIHFHQGSETRKKFNDWTPILSRRGFVDIISGFLNLVKQYPNEKYLYSADFLETHRICENIINQIEK